MNKIRNQSGDIHQKSGLELAKKLYRSTTEQARRLDDARTCARSIADLFSPALQVQRKKFGDYCERLIFIEPLLYGTKCDEILWRKAYYDVINAAKKLKTSATNNTPYTPHERHTILAHINSGIGFYHHYIARLQMEHHLNLQNLVDFTLNVEGAADDAKPPPPDWVLNVVYQSLVYLGDLNRYKIEILPNRSPTLAFRYYLQAIHMKPDRGMPHNQMGTLAMQQERFLDAVYHYLCCLSCSVSFEGTLNNLRNLFDKNARQYERLQSLESSEKRFVTRFLHLIDLWYFSTNQPNPSSVYEMCHETYKELEQCLQPSSKSCSTPTDDSELNNNQEVAMTGEQIFKSVAIALMCVSRMQRNHSVQISTAVAFTLALYSLLIQNLIEHIRDSVLNYPLPEVDYRADNAKNGGGGVVKDLLKKRSSNAKLRRKKAMRREDDEDTSEDEEAEDSSDDEDASSYDSFDSGEVAESCSSESDEEANIKGPGQANDPKLSEETDADPLISRIKRMDVDDMLEIITEQSSLQAIKIVNDWLMHDTDTIRSCANNNTKTLLRQICDMLNLINVDVKNGRLTGVKLNVTEIVRNESKIPLAEDIMLKNIDLLGRAHKNIDWTWNMNRRGLNVKEESVVRIVKFLNFGKYLCGIPDTAIGYNEKRNVFVWNGKEEVVGGESGQSNGIALSDGQDDSSSPPQQQIDSVVPAIMPISTNDIVSVTGLSKMKHMGQLWLASEVKALESQVRSGKTTSLSPYLVLDSDALIKYTFMVKHLVHSRKFIVVIPTAVVSALDDLKRSQSEARDAIRWLESQFHRGNRFFRAQRAQERAAIPFIKYPKKRDKEMVTYIQMVECCYYLAEQQKGASNVVTLLIGNQNVLANGENREFSYVGLATQAGIAIESIAHFHAKWKKNYGKTKR